MHRQIVLSFFVLSLFIYVHGQQKYSGNSVLNCDGDDRDGPSPAFLYTCNGGRRACQAFLIFKSQPPYDSVPAISTLLSSDQAGVARINNVTRLAVFPTGKEVIVPVNCSCSAQYYRAISLFPVTSGANDTYFTVANDTYQGLSTCSSLKRANAHGESGLEGPGELRVPLRCACPTRNQTVNGVRYLLTFSINWRDTITGIGERFNASAEDILTENGISEANPTIFPFTTILVPLVTEPSSSQTTLLYQEQPSLPPPTYVSSRREPNKELYLGVGVAAGGLLVTLFAAFACFLWHKKKKEAVPQFRGQASRKSASPVDLRVEIASLEEILKVFTFEEIKKATQNFSSRNRIQGSVFRGAFGQETLAVKRVSRDVSNEVNILKKINHFNLIKLRGFCEFNRCFYLVFEYMSYGSLRDWLSSGKSSKKTRSWSHRINIALDVANGLHYLHSFTKPAYVHKDINSSNILLNGDLRAKIANFGLARVAGRETSSASLTTHHRGGRGYMPPEYIKPGLVTSKTDVYGFGMMLLELITGKGAVILQDGREVLLSAAIASAMEGDDTETEILQSFIDPRLERSGRGLAMRMVRLSLTCLAHEPTRRPGMEEIAATLLKIQADLKAQEILPSPLKLGRKK
ncbi:protein LYK5-like [Rhodamnia argentea]|uniref:Protein LYK5-like n=1 Tax=Rhodamnia argentea TaxID=178133 RepID=A0A8B8QGT7_9MYRT|nr:protein LYK5-like [Rhodamnia argentea]